MSVGAVNKSTGERIPAAGMPVIDVALSGSSTNPVQNRVVKAALDEKADTDIVASDFDATASYTAGNYCIYEGKFYRFKTTHSGAWVAADVDEIKIAGELSALKSGLITPSGSNLLLGSAAIDGGNPVTVSLGDNNISDYDFIWIGTAYYNSGVATYGCALIPVILMHYLYSGDAGVSIISRDNTNQGVIPINAVYDSTNNNIRFSPEGTPGGQYYFVNGVKIRTAS